MVGLASTYYTHHRVFYNVCQCDDVGTASQILQNLYFTLDFLLLYWLKGQKYISEIKCVWVFQQIM